MAGQLAIVEGPDPASTGTGLTIVEGPEGHEQTGPPSTAKSRSLARRAAVEQRRQAGQEPALEALEGFGRGALSTVQTLASPIRKAFGMAPAAPPPEETTRAGRMGRATEQLGEFVVPEAVAGKITEGVKAAPLVKTAFKAGLTGVGTYGVAKGQKEEHPGLAAAMGAAGPVAELTLPAAEKLLRAGARRGLERVLGARPTSPKAFTEAIQKVVPVALDEGLKPTWASWLRQRGTASAKAGTALETALKGPLGGALVPTKPVIKALDDLANKSAQHIMRAEETLAGASADKPLVGSVTSGRVVYNKRLMKAIDDVKSVLKQHGDLVQARQLHDLKQSWDKFVYKGSEFKSAAELLASFEAQAKHTAANAVRGVLESDAPTLSKLDQAYSLNKRLEAAVLKAARAGEQSPETAKVASRLPSLISRRAGVAGVGAAVGGTYGYQREGVGGALGGAILGGLTGRMLDAAFSSPAWRTAPAATKQALAEAIANGQAEKVRRLLGPILAKTAAGAPKGQ